MKTLFLSFLVEIFSWEEVVYGMGVFISGVGPQFPKLPYDIVRILTLMIYSSFVE